MGAPRSVGVVSALPFAAAPARAGKEAGGDRALPGADAGLRRGAVAARHRRRGQGPRTKRRACGSTWTARDGGGADEWIVCWYLPHRRERRPGRSTSSTPASTACWALRHPAALQELLRVTQYQPQQFPANGRHADGAGLLYRAAADGQRHQPRLRLRADRHRLHAGLRHHPRHQFRVRRDLHARRLRSPSSPMWS